MEHLDKKIKAFLKLGKYLRGKKIDSELNELILKTENNNAWFIYKNIIRLTLFQTINLARHAGKSFW